MSRELLAELAANGLTDVAFHVDTTQARSGYDSERALTVIREAYIERARGLGLSVSFYTTITVDNQQEIPNLVRFFMRHSDVIRMGSFQPSPTCAGISTAAPLPISTPMPNVRG